MRCCVSASNKEVLGISYGVSDHDVITFLHVHQVCDRNFSEHWYQVIICVWNMELISRRANGPTI